MLRTMTLQDAIDVVSRMREMDRACVSAALGDVDDETFAVDRWRTNGPAWTLEEGGRAVAVGGLSLLTAWSAVLWIVATDELGRQSWRKLLRHTRTVLAQVLDARHALHRRRVEAHVLGSWPGAKAVVRSLGMQHEGTRHCAGSGGEDIEIWAVWRP